MKRTRNEPQNLDEPQMLQWFRRTYLSYNLQPLLLKRQRGAAAPGRREPADGGRAPPGPLAALRVRSARRAQGRQTRSGRSCRAVTLKEIKTLWAHGFSQRPCFDTNKLLGIIGPATHSSNLGGWAGEKSKALKLERKERFEPQAATQQLRAPV